jgi:hypothetical protein
MVETTTIEDIGNGMKIENNIHYSGMKSEIKRLGRERHGRCRWWDYTGVLLSEENYFLGRLHGMKKSFNVKQIIRDDYSGLLMPSDKTCYYFYIHGVQDGEQIDYDNL